MRLKKGFILTVLTLILILSLPVVVDAYVGERIVLDNPDLVDESLDRVYDLESIDLRLPRVYIEILNEKSQNKLINLISLYGSRDDLHLSNDSLVEDGYNIDNIEEYRISLEAEEGNKTLMSPIPGMSVDADYNKGEEDNQLKENTNISLKYWMNNRTLIRAEYDIENREWWDIEDIKLGDNDGEESPDDEISEGEMASGVIFNEEKKETSRLGISYQTNDNVTISADYVDSTSIEKDFSTIFGVEYRDELGTVKYQYQVDFGEEKAKETVLEFGYKDLATFNASYKIFNKEAIEDQLKKTSIWDFAFDYNLSDISTISLGYQIEQGERSDSHNNLKDDEESNIQAQLKIKF